MTIALFVVESSHLSIISILSLLGYLNLIIIWLSQSYNYLVISILSLLDYLNLITKDVCYKSGVTLLSLPN